MEGRESLGGFSPLLTHSDEKKYSERKRRGSETDHLLFPFSEKESFFLPSSSAPIPETERKKANGELQKFFSFSDR